MSRILVLTKNVLAETALQSQLQQLNYEVLVSSSIYTQLCYQMPIYEELTGFQVVLFSETLTDEEIEEALPILIESNIPLMQRVDMVIPEEEQEEWQRKYNIIPCPINLSSRELKQTLEDAIREVAEDVLNHVQFETKQDIITKKERVSLMQHISFTKIEQRILEVLYQAKGKLVTKEVLCEEVWGQPLTKSRLVQIYTSIGRIKDKLQALQPNTLFIGAQRSVGYFLTPAFFDYFELGLPFYENRANPVSA